MLTKIKFFFITVGSIAMAILYALLQKEKAERADEHEQIAEATLKQKTKSNDAYIEGMENEAEVKNAKVTDSIVDHFSK